ncbi:protein of unknown function [Agrobacterium pusense]|uniref:Uncharacterized protein n=1 Tax=Agrobacterium pusense TaxID=648995 RepID=U4QAS0_9HYPH|nr:protein of unknown function [Agrobacterium pusense]
MGREAYLDPRIDVGPFGMMIEPLCDECGFSHETEGFRKAGKLEGTDDRRPVFAQGPTLQFLQGLPDGIGLESGIFHEFASALNPLTLQRPDRRIFHETYSYSLRLHGQYLPLTVGRRDFEEPCRQRSASSAYRRFRRHRRMAQG